jgi:hypothetical protein
MKGLEKEHHPFAGMDRSLEDFENGEEGYG